MLLPTQLFFDVTDIIPGFTLYTLLRQSTGRPLPWLLYSSMIVSATHTFQSLWDQGFAHIISLRGPVIRDAMLAVSDLAGLVGVGWYVRDRLQKDRGILGIGTGILVMSYLILKRITGYS